MIKTIQAANFKGQNFRHELAPLTLISGLLGAGKTARLEALVVGLLGYHPSLGKQGKATFKLASGEAMEVCLSTDAGDISRTWKATGRGVSANVSGPEFSGIPAALDSGLFISASPTAKAALIRQLYPSAADPRDALKAAVLAVAPGLVIAWPKAEDLNAWLDEAADAIKAAGSEQKGIVDRMTKALQAWATLDLTATVSTADDEAALAEAERIKREKITAAALAEQAFQAEQQKALQAQASERRLASMLSDGPAGNVGDKIEALAADIAEIQARLDMAEASAERISKENTQRGQLRSRIADFSQAYGEAPPTEPSAIMKPILPAAGSPEALKAVIARHEAAKKAVEDARRALDESDICPHCGASREHWSRQHAAAPTVTPEELAALETAENIARGERVKVEEIVASYREALERFSEVAEDHADALKAWNAYGMARQKAEDAQAALVRMGVDDEPLPNSESIAEELDAETAALEDLKATHERWQIIEEHRAAQAAAKRACDSWQWAADEHEAAKKAVEAASAVYDAALEDFRASSGRASQIKQREETEAIISKATLLIEQSKAALATLKDQFRELASAALAPLLDTANVFLADLTFGPLAAVGLEIGMWKGDQWIGFETFSGGERAIATAAIQAAIASTGSPGFRLAMLDEFNAVTGGENRERFLANLGKAIKSGLIDQAVVLDNKTFTAAENVAGGEFVEVLEIDLTRPE